MRILLFALCIFCLTPLVTGQEKPLRKEPMTIKELALMIRMGMPEAEWLAELRERKLLEPLSDEDLKLLGSSGATPEMVGKVRQAGLVLDESTAEAAKQQKAEREARAQEELERLRLRAESNKSSQPQQKTTGAQDAMVKLLTGKMVSVSADSWQEFDARKLNRVRYFVFYSSASWCQPCHAFTPKLIEFYEKMKPLHPEFEVVLLSRDNNKFNAQGYTRQYRMPWLGVDFEATPEFAKAFSGKFIPFLAIVRNDGQVLLPSHKVEFEKMRAEDTLQFRRQILEGRFPGV